MKRVIPFLLVIFVSVRAVTGQQDQVTSTTTTEAPTSTPPTTTEAPTTAAPPTRCENLYEGLGSWSRRGRCFQQPFPGCTTDCRTAWDLFSYQCKGENVRTRTCLPALDSLKVNSAAFFNLMCPSTGDIAVSSQALLSCNVDWMALHDDTCDGAILTFLTIAKMGECSSEALDFLPGSDTLAYDAEESCPRACQNAMALIRRDCADLIRAEDASSDIPFIERVFNVDHLPITAFQDIFWPLTIKKYGEIQLWYRNLPLSPSCSKKYNEGTPSAEASRETSIGEDELPSATTTPSLSAASLGIVTDSLAALLALFAAW